MIPFSAIRTYRASVVRALSNIALARIAHVPIPTNPNKVVNSLFSLAKNTYKGVEPVEIEIGKRLQRNDTTVSSCGSGVIRTSVGTDNV